MTDLSRAKLQKIFPRKWGELKQKWLDYIPEIDEPGSVPQERVVNSIILRDHVAKIIDNQPFIIPEDIPEIKHFALKEGLFWLHKAGNVIGASQIHINEGIKSWSLSSAYHSALFATKAILPFLGIVVTEFPERGSFLVDLWSEEIAKKSKIRIRSYDTIKVLKVCRIEHRHIWTLLQRMLTITEFPVEVITLENVESLKSLAKNDFAKQRNKLHYRPTWIFDDIHQQMFDSSFLNFESQLTDGSALSDPDIDNFSFALAFVLMRMAIRMLVDIADFSPIIKTELDLLQSWLNKDFNKPYNLVKC